MARYKVGFVPNPGNQVLLYGPQSLPPRRLSGAGMSVPAMGVQGRGYLQLLQVITGVQPGITPDHQIYTQPLGK